MIISAKFPGRCSKCHGSIQVGSKIEWSKGGPVAHAACGPAVPLSVDGEPAKLGQHWSSRGRGPVVRLCAGGCGRRVGPRYAECYSCHQESIEAM